MDLVKYLECEPPHLPLLRFLFKDSPALCIFDVGCCEGEDSLRYLRAFSTAMVFGFEPCPANISRIESVGELTSSERFRLVRAAVSNTAGETTLHLSSGHPPDKKNTKEWDYGNKSSSLLNPSLLMQQIVPWLCFEKSIRVETTTLDIFAANHNISFIDILHMDIQGAELLAFQGAVQLLPRIGVIWVEVADHQLYQDQPSSKDITEFLVRFGFSLVLTAVSGGLGDHLYVNTEYFLVRKRNDTGYYMSSNIEE